MGSGLKLLLTAKVSLTQGTSDSGSAIEENENVCFEDLQLYVSHIHSEIRKVKNNAEGTMYVYFWH